VVIVVIDYLVQSREAAVVIEAPFMDLLHVPQRAEWGRAVPAVG
jgi:hypothetical protein